MHKDIINTNGTQVDVYSLNTIIVGTGAAGFNAADTLYSLGQKDIAIVTEGINMGTSRNTGSDKQTYYKLTLSGNTPDSVEEMAKTLFNGGSMHGDIALVEAALSARSFCKLASIGVPFPHNKYGEYIGYKTDHDPRQRATSAGPLTSKFMTEKLEEQVKQKGIKIFDGYQVIGILTDSSGSEKKAIGLITLEINPKDEPKVALFNCTNIIYATGGPAGMYSTSVYPESQSGASGIAFEAGARGINLTESQYGIASIKFRWNLSGTYQQVIPRYVSTNADGKDEKEFLDEYFDSPGKMLDAIFLKGYQWPFDPRKIENFGSSLIDILVYNETQIKGRRVFMDFMNNPSCATKDNEFDFSLLGAESNNYLKNSNALFGTPIKRLQRMNQPAIDLYKNNGIDLTSEYLEIAVCAQHNNGGLMGNCWWESNLQNFFPVGEVNGTFGVYRPGGTALNSTQVGSLRAAQYITANYKAEPLSVSEFTSKAEKDVSGKLNLITAIMSNKTNTDVFELKKKYRIRMTKAGAHIRSAEAVEVAIQDCIKDLNEFSSVTRATSTTELSEAFKNRDILLTQFAYLSAIKEYIKNGGRSRGSYLVRDREGILPIEGLSEEFCFSLDSGEMQYKTCEVELSISGENIKCICEWKPVRPIPTEDNWFENVWNDYRQGKIFS